MHTPTKITAICIVVVSLLFAPRPSSSSAPQSTVPAVVETTTTTTTPTTTTASLLPSGARCGEWWSLARQVGFTESMLPTLDRVIYRESRCDPTQHNAADPNGGSYGLAQVNGFWCLPSRYYPLGYLQTHGVLAACSDLYIPEVALRSALKLVEYSRGAGLCAWHQWAWLDPCED